MTWRLVDLSDPSARRAARARSEAILARDPRRHLFHTLDWMLDAGGRGPESVRVFFLEAPDGTVGYAPFVLQPWRLRFRLGETTLAWRRLTRLHLIGGPLYGPGEPAPDEAALGVALLRAVRRHLVPRQVVFLEGLPLASPLGRLLAGPGRRRVPFHVVAHGGPFPRHLIPLPSTFDAYLARLGRRTREGLRRSRRKLLEHVEADLRLTVVTRPGEVDAFVEMAAAVSRRTYQWHLLGLGLRDPDRLKHGLKVLAERGWTRCYLLEARGAPVAFMIGYHYRGTFHYIDVGFDPGWTRQSVGTVMHLEVLRDLIESENRPGVFDFSTGTGVHKERFSTAARQEVNLLLIPRGVRGAALAALTRTSEALSGALVGLAARLGLKTFLKKWVRQRATRN